MKLTLALFSFIFCFVAFSCQGDEGKPIDYGPAVAQSAVDDALNTPLANADPLKIQVGQFTDVVQTQILEGQAYQTTGEIGTTVVSRDDQDTQVVFTILEKTVSYSDNKTISRELIRIAQKNTATQPATPAASPAPASSSRLTARWFYDTFSQNELIPQVNTLISFMNQHMGIAADTSTASVATTFHNLIVSTTNQAPPDAVTSQPHCGGVPNCMIHVSRIAYDMLVWNDPKTPDKIHREFSISGDVPFFSNVMSECDSLLVPVGTVKTLVTLCSDVTNFRFTTPQ